LSYRIAPAVCVAALIAAAAPAASAHNSTGGASASDAPRVTDARCDTGQSWACRPGATLTLRGEELQRTSFVRFGGGQRARPAAASAHQVVVAVPARASSGPISVLAKDHAVASPRPVRILPAVSGEAVGAPPAQSVVASTPLARFPIDGRWQFGANATNGFGGGRGHQGQDVFAACGTPLVAIVDSTVQFVASHSRAGNYVLLQDDTGQSYAYMHMRDPAAVAKRDVVRAGDLVGYVGETGRASGCHLHFELWVAPGWYEGGSAVDPLPALKQWSGQ